MLRFIVELISKLEAACIIVAVLLALAAVIVPALVPTFKNRLTQTIGIVFACTLGLGSLCGIFTTRILLNGVDDTDAERLLRKDDMALNAIRLAEQYGAPHLRLHTGLEYMAKPGEAPNTIRASSTVLEDTQNHLLYEFDRDDTITMREGSFSPYTPLGNSEQRPLKGLLLVFYQEPYKAR